MTAKKLAEIPDSAYGCPEWIKEPELISLYEILIDRMRRESEDLPMPTVTWILMERIATNYVILRWKERQHVDGKPTGFEHGTAQKDYNTFFLSMLAEFNKQLARFAPKPGMEDPTKILDAVKGALSRAFDNLPEEHAGVARQAIATAFTDAGL